MRFRLVLHRLRIRIVNDDGTYTPATLNVTPDHEERVVQPNNDDVNVMVGNTNITHSGGVFWTWRRVDD